MAPAPPGGWHWITDAILLSYFFNAESVDHFSFLGQKGIISGLVIGKVYAKPARIAFKTPANFLRRERHGQRVSHWDSEGKAFFRKYGRSPVHRKLKLGTGPGHYARFLLNQDYQSAKINHHSHHAHSHGSWNQHNRPVNPQSHICGAHPTPPQQPQPFPSPQPSSRPFSYRQDCRKHCRH